MKPITTFLTILFITLLSSPSWSDELSMGDLVLRSDLYYKKFTNIPFTGEVVGKEIGKFKNGKREGYWEEYHRNGQLKWSVTYIDGLEDGSWEIFSKTGQLEVRGSHKNGRLEGVFEQYWGNGNLFRKGNYKDGKQHGLWKLLNEDGSVEKTETYKDGELIE